MSVLGEFSLGVEEPLLHLVFFFFFISSSPANCCIAAMGGSYEFFRYAAANLRQKDDSYNPAIGGFVAGSVMGLRCMI
jgi:hypothetical protein